MNKKSVTRLVNIYLVVVLLICLIVVVQTFQQPNCELPMEGYLLDMPSPIRESSKDTAWEGWSPSVLQPWQDIGGPSRSPYWYETNCELSAQGEYINCP